MLNAAGIPTAVCVLRSSVDEPFHLVLYTWTASIEQAHEDYALGHCPEKSLTPYRHNTSAVLKTLGGAQWLAERNPVFTDEFKEFVENLLTDPPPGYETASALPHSI